MIDLLVWVPFLPPSSNNIYINHPQGHGRILSTKARAFKIQAMRVIQQEGRVAFLNLVSNVPYELRIMVFFDQTEYKKSEKGAKYKRIDLSNQVKLIEDTVAEATGIGDEHNFRMVLEKHCDPETPGMYVQLTRIDEKQIGLTKAQFDLRNKDRRSDGEFVQIRSVEPDRVGRVVPKLRLPRGSSRNKQS